MFMSMVLLAFVTSVTKAPPLGPPVRFWQVQRSVPSEEEGGKTEEREERKKKKGGITQISQVSMVPNLNVPFFKASLISGVEWSRIHRYFTALKYVASGSPHFS